MRFGSPVTFTPLKTVTVTKILNPVTVKVTVLPPPPSNPTGILTVRRTLLGTTTPVAHRVKLATTTAFNTLEVGVKVTGTKANTGPLIYIAGSNISTNSFAIPASSGSHGFSWKKAKIIYLLGKAGDIANVWAE